MTMKLKQAIRTLKEFNAMMVRALVDALNRGHRQAERRKRKEQDRE